MKRLIEIIMANEYLSTQEASEFIHAIADERITQEEVAAILTGLQLRGVRIDEIEGFRSALLDRVVRPNLNTENAIDLCGTGGDGKDTFNISTTSALVLAALGYRVIKHGNYGVSSSCGSSNVLESLGFQFSSDEKELNEQLEKTNICFLHAPLFHPTLKKVAAVRKNLGVRTVFNVLGPLVNPVQPPYQLTGTYSLELARMYQHLLRPHRVSYNVVHGMDGYDEISLTDNTRILSAATDHILSANSIGTSPVGASDLHSGGTIENSVKLAKEILRGHGTEAQNKVVAVNVALGRMTFDPGIQLQDCFTDSLEFIESGQTAKHFKL